MGQELDRGPGVIELGLRDLLLLPRDVGMSLGQHDLLVADRHLALGELALQLPLLAATLEACLGRTDLGGSLRADLQALGAGVDVRGHADRGRCAQPAGQSGPRKPPEAAAVAACAEVNTASAATTAMPAAPAATRAAMVAVSQSFRPASIQPW